MPDPCPTCAAAREEAGRLREALGQLAGRGALVVHDNPLYAEGRCRWCYEETGHRPECPDAIASAALQGAPGGERDG